MRCKLGSCDCLHWIGVLSWCFKFGVDGKTMVRMVVWSYCAHFGLLFVERKCVFGAYDGLHSYSFPSSLIMAFSWRYIRNLIRRAVRSVPFCGTIVFNLLQPEKIWFIGPFVLNLFWKVRRTLLAATGPRDLMTCLDTRMPPLRAHCSAFMFPNRMQAWL